jgi:F0F1-type ATP synthase membrane subunit a
MGEPDDNPYWMPLEAGTTPRKRMAWAWIGGWILTIFAGIALAYVFICLAGWYLAEVLP